MLFGHHLEILNRFLSLSWCFVNEVQGDSGAWSGAWSLLSLAAPLPSASSFISLRCVLGYLLPDPAQVLLQHRTPTGELQGRRDDSGVCVPLAESKGRATGTLGGFILTP